MKKENFVLEEDRIIGAECENCKMIVDDEEEIEAGICPECGGRILSETLHEGCECSLCYEYMDMWDDAYRHRKRYNVLICERCYKELG